jgi:hypothetical protein
MAITYRILPYRATNDRELVRRSAEAAVAQAYITTVKGNPLVRTGYWYDLQKAGATAYDGSNMITFASSTNKYGFPYSAQLSITVPQARAFSFYGIADYSPNPSLQAWEIIQHSTNFPLMYLSPDIYTNEDHKAIMNSYIGEPDVQNDTVVINLYGTAATTDPIDLLFVVAEPAASSA